MNTPVKATQKRVTRRPLHQQGPMTILGEKDPDFVYRVVNDVGARVSQMQAAGYEIVTDDGITIGESRVSDPNQLGSSKRVLSKDGTVSILMRQKREWWEEDQKAKQQQIDEQESAMKQDAAQGMYGKIETSRK